MATKKKKGGRVTPKGGNVNPAKMQGNNSDSVEASTRYTPPTAGQYKAPSPQSMLYLLFGLLGFGTLIIFLYYLGFVPGGRSNWYLAAGLFSLLGGLYTATKYH